MDLNTLAEQGNLIQQYLIPWGITIVMALAIFIIGRWVARMITKAAKRLMQKSGLDEMLSKFLGNIIYTALLIVVIVAALDQLGVDTTSVLAIFATAGLAIGLALKDSLSNFSAGVMLIFFKPFKIGDFIEAAGTSGVVEGIHIFNTILRSGDNREITVPNAQIYGGTIINVTARETRRIDMVFGIGYDDDIRKAKQIIEDVLKADERVMTDPAWTIGVLELADNSVNIAVRPWVKTSDYWLTFLDLNENIKHAFDENGISIPYPQRDIHVHQAQQDAQQQAA